MKFENILYQLVNGAKVTRDIWNNASSRSFIQIDVFDGLQVLVMTIIIDNYEFDFNNPVPNQRLYPDKREIQYSLQLEDILASDWRLLEVYR